MVTQHNTPKHKVRIRRTQNIALYFVVTCSVCGRLGYYDTREKAINRKSTHDREQDAGAD